MRGGRTQILAPAPAPALRGGAGGGAGARAPKRSLGRRRRWAAVQRNGGFGARSPTGRNKPETCRAWVCSIKSSASAVRIISPELALLRAGTLIGIRSAIPLPSGVGIRRRNPPTPRWGRRSSCSFRFVRFALKPVTLTRGARIPPIGKPGAREPVAPVRPSLAWFRGSLAGGRGPHRAAFVQRLHPLLRECFEQMLDPVPAERRPLAGSIEAH